MTTESFAETLVGTRSQLDQWRHRRQLRDSTDDDDTPTVAKRTSMFPANSNGPPTVIDLIEARGQDKRAIAAFHKQQKRDIPKVREQLADRRRPLPTTPEEFARRLKNR